MNIERTFIEQHVSFWFAIEAADAGTAATDRERRAASDPRRLAESLWQRAVDVLAQVHSQHPDYLDRVEHDRGALRTPNWAFCEQSPDMEVDSSGTPAWPITFMSDRQMVRPEHRDALRELCFDALIRQATSARVRYLRTTTRTTHHETIIETLEERDPDEVVQDSPDSEQ